MCGDHFREPHEICDNVSLDRNRVHHSILEVRGLGMVMHGDWPSGMGVIWSNSTFFRCGAAVVGFGHGNGTGTRQ